MSRQCGLNRIRRAQDSYSDFPLQWVRKSERVIPASSKAISAANGLRYERKCLTALARGDFLPRLISTFSIQKGNATVAFFQLSDDKEKPNKEKIFQILHNPCFEYKLENEITSRFCFPDILIEIDIPANQSPANAANSSPANSNLIPANLDSDAANIIPANLTKFIILIEVKLTWVPIAWEKLISLYLLIVAKLYNLPILPLVIVKNLTKNSPPSTANLTDALISEFPLLYFPAQRFTSIT